MLTVSLDVFEGIFPHLFALPLLLATIKQNLNLRLLLFVFTYINLQIRNDLEYLAVKHITANSAAILIHLNDTINGSFPQF